MAAPGDRDSARDAPRRRTAGHDYAERVPDDVRRGFADVAAAVEAVKEAATSAYHHGEDTYWQSFMADLSLVVPNSTPADVQELRAAAATLNRFVHSHYWDMEYRLKELTAGLNPLSRMRLLGVKLGLANTRTAAKRALKAADAFLRNAPRRQTAGHGDVQRVPDDVRQGFADVAAAVEAVKEAATSGYYHGKGTHWQLFVADLSRVVFNATPADVQELRDAAAALNWFVHSHYWDMERRLKGLTADPYPFSRTRLFEIKFKLADTRAAAERALGAADAFLATNQGVAGARLDEEQQGAGRAAGQGRRRERRRSRDDDDDLVRTPTNVLHPARAAARGAAEEHQLHVDRVMRGREAAQDHDRPAWPTRTTDAVAAWWRGGAEGTSAACAGCAAPLAAHGGGWVHPQRPAVAVCGRACALRAR